MNLIEILGITASIFVLISFLFKKITTIRLINIVGCILFIAYGICINSFSTYFLNGMVLIVHSCYLIHNYIKKKKSK